MSVESDPHTRPSSANRTHPAEAMDAVRKALLDARREIRGFLVRRLKERTAAEDVLQQFSLRALERSSELRDVKSVRGWLSRILSSVIADYQRSEVRRRNMKAAVRQSTLSDEEFEPEPEIDSAVCQCLHHLMPTLRPARRGSAWRKVWALLPATSLFGSIVRARRSANGSNSFAPHARNTDIKTAPARK